MSTTNPCGGLSRNLESGSICNPGYIAGVYLFETKPAAITEANAALEATWDALALLSQTNRLMHIPFFITEPGESTPDEVEGSDGGKVIVSSTQATDTYKVVESLAGTDTIYGQLKSGQDLYAIFYTSNGYLKGKEVTANTIEAIKYRVTSTLTAQAPKELGYVNIHMTALEDFEEFTTIIDPDFDPKALDTVKSMTFTATDDTLTTLTISAKDLNKVGITDLNTAGAGNFILTNTTGSATVTVTGIVRTGYSYVLSFTSQTEGNAWSLGYEEPDVSSELYDLKTVITGTFTAS